MRRKRIRLSKEQREARDAELASRQVVENVALGIEAKRIDKAKADATAVLDRRSTSWGAVGEQWDQQRAQEAEAARVAAKERKRRRKLDLPNAKVYPVLAQTFEGEHVMVDSLSGRFNLMVKREGWPREIGEACQRFEHDYQLSLGGIRGQSLEPHVDGGKSPQNTAQIEAIQTMRDIEGGMHPEEWVVLVLWAGHGVSITEMHRNGWGIKDELGRRLKRAASRAAAYYQGGHLTFLAEVSDSYHLMANAILRMVKGSAVSARAPDRGAPSVAQPGAVAKD